MTYTGAGSVVIDPTNLGPRELLAIYNGNNNCIGHNGPPEGGQTDMSGYYATTAVATSEYYGKFWPIYRTGFELYPNNTAAPPNAPEGAFDSDVCRSSLEETCTPSHHQNYGRYPVLTASYTVEEAAAKNQVLTNKIGLQEPSAFVDDVHASFIFKDYPDKDRRDIYLYTVQISTCAPEYCKTFEPHHQGALTVARAKLNGGTAPLKFIWWYGNPDSVTYDNYVMGTTEASFALQTDYYNGTPFTNAGTGYDGGGLNAPIFPMDPNRSGESYLTCQSGGGGDTHDQRQVTGSISCVPATRQYLLTFLCLSPSDPAHGKPPSFNDANPQDGAAIFYSTMDADRYDLSHQDKWSPPKEVPGSWEPFTDNFNRYTGWYPSFMSMGINKDGTNPAHYNPGYLSTSGYIFSMEGCLGQDCKDPRVYNSRRFWIDIK